MCLAAKQERLRRMSPTVIPCIRRPRSPHFTRITFGCGYAALGAMQATVKEGYGSYNKV